MTRKLSLLLVVLVTMLLAACAPTNGLAQRPPTADQANGDLARTDSQGSVEFIVTPLNLEAHGATLAFDVAISTHSVDLVWNLAAQSVLSTDAGLHVNGLDWPVASGHHVEGRLTFPVKTPEGQAILEGAKTLTLTIQDAGAAARVFEWELSTLNTAASGCERAMDSLSVQSLMGNCLWYPIG